MSTLSKLSKLFPSSLHFQKHAVPTILIQGLITPQTTLHVHTMLQKIPQNKTKIAILINSQGGCLAQTSIILKKISQLAIRNKAQVWTFGQQWSLNAGFLLLASGNRVFVDNTTVVGGLQVGQSKLLRGTLADYISTVTYSRNPSYLSELNSSQPANPAVKEQLLNVYQRFSSQMEGEIRKLRKNKINTGTDLGKFYVGQEAVSAGLADTVDRIHLAMNRQSLQVDSILLQKNKWQKWLQRIRKFNISD